MQDGDNHRPVVAITATAQPSRFAGIASLPRLAIRFSWIAYRRFLADRCLIGASALSYATLVSLVPLTALVLVTLSGFAAFGDMRDRILQSIINDFAPSIGDQAAGWFSFAANNAAQSTAIGVGSLIVTSILLLATIEDQLNQIFRVAAPRAWTQRILIYWTMLTLGPLLLGLGISVSGDVSALVSGVIAGHATAAAFTVGWSAVWARLLAFILETAAITALYALVPNRQIHWAHCVSGAAIATALLGLLKSGFSVFVEQLASYNKVYGALAGIPIFLLWMYIFWLVVLLGAEITAALSRRASRSAP